MFLFDSKAGIKRLQIEAAIMTPDASPKRSSLILLLKSFLKKNTNADPAVVITKIKLIPINEAKYLSMTYYIHSIVSMTIGFVPTSSFTISKAL